MKRLALLFLPLLLASAPAASPEAEKQSLEAQVTKLTAAIAGTPSAVRLYSQRGDAFLFLGRFKECVADFEKMIALDPAQDAPHWRLGIAYYFAGEFEKSSKQFVKYQQHEHRDRENGIWKYMADARTMGVEKARGLMIEFTEFDREPFPALYDMFAGKKSSDDVLAHLKAKELEKDGAPAFFAHYYTGVHEALLGHRERALELLKMAAASEWGQTAEGGPAYMYRVAKLHLAQVEAEAKK